MAGAGLALALLVAAAALTACAPAGDVPYGSIYGGGYPGAYGTSASAPAMVPTPWEFGQQRGPGDAAERDAGGRAAAAAGRSALRDAELRRHGDRARRAGVEEDRARRALQAAERERRSAEWQDRRPVGTGPFDRADAVRRGALTEAQRARAGLQRAAGGASSAEARLDRLSRIDAAQDRLDRIERMQARQEARRQLLATRSDEDEAVRRYLSYRQRGESADAFRKRVREAGAAARRQGVPVRDLLRGGAVR